MIEAHSFQKSRYTQWDVVKIATCWRLIVLISAIILFNLYGEVDTSSELILFEHNAGNIQEGILFTLLRSLIKWDAVHFLGIAKNGYVFEQQFAFFPGLPYITKGFAFIIQPLTLSLTSPTRLALAAIILTNITFILATWMLYKVTCLVFDDKYAWTSALLFTFTPTPGFMSSMYTEPYFALLNFTGIYFYHKKEFWFASISWMFSTFFRSNGILFIGYPVFDILFVYKLTTRPFNKKSCIKILIITIQCIMILSPFFLFQYFGYFKFCIEGPVLGKSPWCKSIFPFIYPYVQSEYWGTALFHFFNPFDKEQVVPAIPFVTFSVYGIVTYAKADWLRFKTIDIYQSKLTEGSTFDNYSLPSLNVPQIPHYLKTSILPHIYLWMILVFCNFSSMYLAVILRFLTSMPTLYWFAAHLVKSNIIQGYVVLAYWVVYGIFALMLFVGHFPPA